jgi:hypothetical protein
LKFQRPSQDAKWLITNFFSKPAREKNPESFIQIYTSAAQLTILIIEAAQFRGMEKYTAL